MKKFLFFLIAIYFIGCGTDQVTIDKVAKKGLTDIHKGMTKKEVMKVLQQEPDTIQKIGNYELWIYEGISKDKDKEISRYKNFSIKFKDGKVDYTGYFGCKLPKTEE